MSESFKDLTNKVLELYLPFENDTEPDIPELIIEFKNPQTAVIKRNTKNEKGIVVRNIYLSDNNNDYKRLLEKIKYIIKDIIDKEKLVPDYDDGIMIIDVCLDDDCIGAEVFEDEITKVLYTLIDDVVMDYNNILENT